MTLEGERQTSETKDSSFSKTKNDAYNTVAVLGSKWTHSGIFSLLDLFIVSGKDIMHLLKTRDYGRGMIRNNKC